MAGFHDPFYQRYLRPVHLVTRYGLGYDAGNKLFAWELMSYFHSCSSIETFLARLALDRLAGYEREYASDRESLTLWNLSLLQNSGWLWIGAALGRPPLSAEGSFQWPLT